MGRVIFVQNVVHKTVERRTINVHYEVYGAQLHLSKSTDYSDVLQS